jgi:signal transduction histidine kinase
VYWTATGHAPYSPLVGLLRRFALLPAAAIMASSCIAVRSASAEAAVPGDAALGFSAIGVVGAAGVVLLALFGRTWLVRRRRLYALLSELPGGVAVYRGRRVGPFWHSRAFVRLLGSTVLLPAEGIAEADRPRFVAAFGALRDQGKAFDLLLGRASDGNLLRVTGRRSAAGDDVLWVAEADATAAPDGFSELLDSLPMPIWLRGPDMELAWCNAAYAKALDQGRAGVLRDRLELDGSISAGALAKRAKQLNRVQEESRHLVTAGRRLLFEFAEVPLPAGRMAGYARDVTAIEAVQAELGRQVASQDELLENLGAAVAVFGPDTRLRFFNTAFARLFDLGEAMLKAEPTLDEVYEVGRERRRIEDLPDFPAFKREQIRRLMGVVEPVEDLVHQPSGATIRRVAVPHPFGGVLLIHEDVTDRLALERSYNTLIDVQRDTLDNLGEGIAVFGGDGRLRLSNPAFGRLWELSEQQLDGAPRLATVAEAFRPLLSGNDWQILHQQMIAGLEERRPRAGRFTRSDGKVIDFVALPLPDGGVLFRFADISDSVRVQRALIERNEALETADRLKTEFLANISYELRTPLTTIIGFAEILEQRFFGPLNDRQVEYAGGIVSASGTLLTLIDDILDLANIEAGYLRLDPGTVEIPDLFHDLGALMTERARSGGVALTFEIVPDIGGLVADKRRLKQALFNLISNAIKFTPAKGRVTVTAQRDGDMAEFIVEDTGIGIAAADQARIFDKFVRVGTGRQSGVGLGLALVRSIIGLHGGAVELTSEAGKGTIVTCRIPAAGPRGVQPAAVLAAAG